MENDRKIYRLTLASSDVPAFLGACEASEWYVLDTGERIMTEEGPDAEAVLLVEPVSRSVVKTPAELMH